MFLVFRQYLSADRDLDNQVLAAGTGAVATRAALAARCPQMLGIAKVDQRIEAFHSTKDNVSPLAAIASVGSAKLDIFLAPETDSTGPAPTGAHVDLGLIEKMHVAAFREGDAERPDLVATNPICAMHGLLSGENGHAWFIEFFDFSQEDNCLGLCLGKV